MADELRSREPQAVFYENTRPLGLKDDFILRPQPAQLNFSAATSIPGCFFGTVNEVFQNGESSKFKPHLFSLIDPNGKNSLQALHRKHWDNGICLSVSKGTRIARPLRSETYLNAQVSGAGYFPHHLVVLEPGARVTWVEELRSSGDSPILNGGVVEVFLGEEAEFNYVVFQDLSANARSFCFEFARLDRGAKFNLFHVEMGALVRRLEIVCDCLGIGSASKIDGVYYGRGAQSLEAFVVQNHKALATESNMLWKTAMTGRSRSKFQGLISIARQANRSQAFQTINNLLLSREASATPDPRLEILADDVQAKHAATVSYLEEEARFYLMSRGISPAQTDKVLTMAFFSEALGHLEPEIHQEAVVRLEERIGRD